MEQRTEQTMQEEPRAWNDNRERVHVATVLATAVAKKANLVEKSRAAQLSKKAVFGLMVAAAVLTMIVGFRWGGWVTGGAAQRRVSAGAENAVALRLVPICVAQFNLDPQRTPKLAELKAITSSRDRPDYVKKQGWATMPGEETPDNDVANACAKLLIGS